LTAFRFLGILGIGFHGILEDFIDYNDNDTYLDINIHILYPNEPRITNKKNSYNFYNALNNNGS